MPLIRYSSECTSRKNLKSLKFDQNAWQEIHADSLFRLLAGLAAGALAVAVSIILKDTIGGLFLPEIASQALFSVTPGEFESQAVENFGPLAKYSAFIGSIIANIVVFGIIGNFS